MALSDDCPCGRSQLFTFASSDKIVIDCTTFKEILLLVGHSQDILARIQSQQIFLHCLNSYLLEFDSLDALGLLKASLLLDSWNDSVCCEFEQLSEYLSQAVVTTSVIWAANRLGGEVTNDD